MFHPAARVGTDRQGFALVAAGPAVISARLTVSPGLKKAEFELQWI
jgi:hypothetical protein